MPNIVLYTLVSLDGATEDPNRYFPETGDKHGAPVFDQELARLAGEMIARQGAVLLGRRLLLVLGQAQMLVLAKQEQPGEHVDLHDAGGHDVHADDAAARGRLEELKREAKEKQDHAAIAYAAFALGYSFDHFEPYDFKRAIREFDNALALYPDWVQAKFNRGVARIHDGKYSQAVPPGL